MNVQYYPSWKVAEVQERGIIIN